MSINKKNRVYDSLRRRIIDGELVPGFPVKEADLAQELLVSKTPVREALRQLERDGLIESIPRRGSTVAHITPQSIREVFEIREIIEAGVAKRAAVLRGNEELLRKLEETRQILADTEAADAYVHDWEASDDVHVLIVRELGNTSLLEIYLGLLDRIRRIRTYYGHRFTQRRLREIASEHADILEAMVSGDPERAEQAVERHLRNGGAFVIGLSARERGPDDGVKY